MLAQPEIKRNAIVNPKKKKGQGRAGLRKNIQSRVIPHAPRIQWPKLAEKSITDHESSKENVLQVVEHVEQCPVSEHASSKQK